MLTTTKRQTEVDGKTKRKKSVKTKTTKTQWRTQNLNQQTAEQKSHRIFLQFRQFQKHWKNQTR